MREGMEEGRGFQDRHVVLVVDTRGLCEDNGKIIGKKGERRIHVGAHLRDIGHEIGMQWKILARV